MGDIALSNEGRVAILTMNHESENRFHPDFVTEMMTVLDELEADASVGAVVVTGGDPKFFCNGLDLQWIMTHAGDPKTVMEYLGQVNRMFGRWTLYPKPTVAALNGHTFAAGLFMAAHMDFRFMREDRGWICLPEVDINIPLLPGMIAICQAVMPPQGFRRLYYTGGRFGGADAVEIGFADGVYGAEELLPASIDFAERLAAKSTRTFAEMKRRIRGDVARVLAEEDPAMFLQTLGFALPQ